MSTTARTRALYARRRICAAAAAALEVLDLRARYVSESDDRPRLWLERFARGEERLGACPWREVEHDRPLFALIYRLADAREDVWRHPTHAEGQAGAAVTILARILHDDCGEPDDAASTRAWTIYRAHLARLESEAIAARLTGPTPEDRARAAADRRTAELALGTARGVAKRRYYCWPTGCGVDGVGDRCPECGAPWSAHREIDAATCGSFAPCPSAELVAEPYFPSRRLAAHGHHCTLAPDHAGPHHTVGCDGGATWASA